MSPSPARIDLLNGLVFAAAAWALGCSLAVAQDAALLLNEVESDPPIDVGDRCQYVEILGTPGATIPGATYFVSINSDQDNPGFLNVAVNLSGRTLGANGSLVLVNTLQGSCPNRAYDPGTTVVEYASPTTLGKGAEGFYLVRQEGFINLSPAPGLDLDVDDNGVVDGSYGLVFIDGIQFLFNPREQISYGNGPNLVGTLLRGVPDAAVRLPGNLEPNSRNAWFAGELISGPEESTHLR